MQVAGRPRAAHVGDGDPGQHRRSDELGVVVEELVESVDARACRVRCPRASRCAARRRAGRRPARARRSGSRGPGRRGGSPRRGRPRPGSRSACRRGPPRSRIQRAGCRSRWRSRSGRSGGRARWRSCRPARRTGPRTAPRTVRPGGATAPRSGWSVGCAPGRCDRLKALRSGLTEDRAAGVTADVGIEAPPGGPEEATRRRHGGARSGVFPDGRHDVDTYSGYGWGQLGPHRSAGRRKNVQSRGAAWCGVALDLADLGERGLGAGESHALYVRAAATAPAKSVTRLRETPPAQSPAQPVGPARTTPATSSR